MGNHWGWQRHSIGMEICKVWRSGSSALPVSRHLMTPLLRGAMVPQSAINVGANVEMRCAR